jgi:hypothetical protein
VLLVPFRTSVNIGDTIELLFKIIKPAILAGQKNVEVFVDYRLTESYNFSAIVMSNYA